MISIVARIEGSGGPSGLLVVGCWHCHVGCYSVGPRYYTLSAKSEIRLHTHGFHPVPTTFVLQHSEQ